jgi:small-conductance mechanosensitive channel
MANLLELLKPSAPALLSVVISIVLSILGLALAHWLLFVRKFGTMSVVSRQIMMLVLTLAAVFSPILALVANGESDTAGVLVAVVGLGFSIVMTMSSTTFMSNAMAGLMLRAVRNFRTGDFVRVGDYFGRVTERGLFHVEIQTEDRDLATLPNIYLVSQPVKVVRASGTIVSAELSLGYDVPHDQVEALLQEAALSAGLEKPFVYLLELGNFSVTYRIAGFLPNVEQLLSVRTTLRACVLDTLHKAGIEIVSPTFMNQRPLAEDTVVRPHRASAPASPVVTESSAPEDIMFDKATREERRESLRSEHALLVEQIQALESASADAGQGPVAASSELERLRRRSESIQSAVNSAEESEGNEGPRKA